MEMNDEVKEGKFVLLICLDVEFIFESDIKNLFGIFVDVFGY